MITAGFTRIVVAITVVLLAAGCGSSNAPSASKPSPSPSPSPAPHIASVAACDLVHADEASTAAGATLTNVSAQAGGSTLLCIFAGSGSQSSSGVIVFAQVYPDASAADAIQPDQLAAAAVAGSTVANAKVVTGIGDKAVEYSFSSTGQGGSGIAIFVFKANVLIMIAVAPTTDASKVEALAKIAVGRLPSS